ncbi:MAG: hypothetical protein AAF493_28615 [Pseudomonadota bacterium]
MVAGIVVGASGITASANDAASDTSAPTYPRSFPIEIIDLRQFPQASPNRHTFRGEAPKKVVIYVRFRRMADLGDGCSFAYRETVHQYDTHAESGQTRIVRVEANASTTVALGNGTQFVARCTRGTDGKLYLAAVGFDYTKQAVI